MHALKTFKLMEMVQCNLEENVLGLSITVVPVL